MKSLKRKAPVFGGLSFEDSSNEKMANRNKK